MKRLQTIITAVATFLVLCARNGFAEEAHSIMTQLSSTTLSGYVDTSASWWIGTQSVTPPPPNDSFAAAQVVEAGKLTLPANLAGATLQAGEVSDANQSGSVWYRWNVTTSGLARVSIKELVPIPPASAQSYAPALSTESVFYPWGGISYDGSGDTDGGGGVIVVTIGNPPPIYRPFDVAVYRGDSVENLTLVAHGRDFEFQATAGETLWIDFKTFERNDGFYLLGSFPDSIWLDITPPASNDNFASALLVSDTSGGYFAGNFVGATRESGEPNLGSSYHGASVWFGLAASIHGPIQLTGPTGLPIAVFEGTELANLKFVANGSGTVSFIGELGKHYRIASYYMSAELRSFGISFTAPRYRLYETTVDQLMPNGLKPHFYGVRGSTLMLYSKTATAPGWDLIEIEPITNQATDLLIQPANPVDGQLRVISIDETFPAPHIVFRPARSWIVADLHGVKGQTCEVSFSSDLRNWSAPRIVTLQSSSLPLAAFDPAHPVNFFRITRSLPHAPNAIQVGSQPPIPPEPSGSGAVMTRYPNSSGIRPPIPPPPVPAF